MPLIKSKSKKAVGENIEKEQEAGKPHDQAIAIALEVQRKAKGKKAPPKKMASGGEVAEFGAKRPQPKEPVVMADEDEMDARRRAQKILMGNQAPEPINKAHGGMIEDQEAAHESRPDHEKHYEAIADAILAKREHHEKLADGGMIDLEESVGSEPSDLEHLNHEAAESEAEEVAEHQEKPSSLAEHVMAKRGKK